MRRGGVGQVVRLGSTDDGGGDDRLTEYPGHGDVCHRDATLSGYLVDGLDDRLVDIEVETLGRVVSVAALGVLPPGPGEPALSQRGVRDTAHAHVGAIGSISRLSKLYWFS